MSEGMGELKSACCRGSAEAGMIQEGETPGSDDQISASPGIMIEKRGNDAGEIFQGARVHHREGNTGVRGRF